MQATEKMEQGLVTCHAAFEPCLEKERMMVGTAQVFPLGHARTCVNAASQFYLHASFTYLNHWITPIQASCHLMFHVLVHLVIRYQTARGLGS